MTLSTHHRVRRDKGKSVHGMRLRPRMRSLPSLMTRRARWLGSTTSSQTWKGSPAMTGRVTWAKAISSRSQ